MVHYRKSKLSESERLYCLNEMKSMVKELPQVSTYTQAASIYREIVMLTHFLNQNDYNKLMRFIEHDERDNLYDFIQQLS